MSEQPMTPQETYDALKRLIDTGEDEGIRRMYGQLRSGLLIIEDTSAGWLIRQPNEPRWERCTNCGREYAYPHLCREHMLCGRCHPDIALGPHADVQGICGRCAMPWPCTAARVAGPDQIEPELASDDANLAEHNRHTRERHGWPGDDS